MKLVLTLSFLLFGALSYSGEKNVVIKLSDLDDAIGVSSPVLKVDKSGLGRSWVVVDVDYDDIDDIYTQSYRVKLPGLSHDLNTGKIRFTDGEQEIVCAKVEVKHRSRLFSWLGNKTKIKASGNCQFTAKILKKSELVDDGYDLRKVTKNYLQVSIRF